MADLIEVIANKAVKEFLEGKASDLVSGFILSGSPIATPAITTSPATPPLHDRPFIAVTSSGRQIDLTGSPVTVDKSLLNMTVILRNIITLQPDDDQAYEQATNIHANMGDRIIAVLVKQFNTNRWITHAESGYRFRIEVDVGITKENSGAANDNSLWVIGVSQISFRLRGDCEQETYNN